MRSAVAHGWLSAARIGHVVMLGPPNSGSEVVDALTRMPVLGQLFSWVSGPAGTQLGTDAANYVTQLPPVNFSLGVIAGNRSFNPFFSAILHEESDGKVRVASARARDDRFHRRPAVASATAHRARCHSSSRSFSGVWHIRSSARLTGRVHTVCECLRPNEMILRLAFQCPTRHAVSADHHILLLRRPYALTAPFGNR